MARSDHKPEKSTGFLWLWCHETAKSVEAVVLFRTCCFPNLFRCNWNLMGNINRYFSKRYTTTVGFGQGGSFQDTAAMIMAKCKSTYPLAAVKLSPWQSKVGIKSKRSYFKGIYTNWILWCCLIHVHSILVFWILFCFYQYFDHDYSEYSEKVCGVCLLGALNTWWKISNQSLLMQEEYWKEFQIQSSLICPYND